MVTRQLGRLAMVAGALNLCACATTDPGSAAGIDYRLPRTDVGVTLGIDVVNCSPVQVATTLQMAAVAGQRDGSWHIPGSALSSWFTQRALTVDVDDNGVISGINATATDKTTAIFGDVVKLVASFIPIVGIRTQSIASSASVPTKTLACTKGTQQTLDVVGALQDKLADLKKSALGAANPAAVKKDIDAVASLLAAAQAGLHQDVAATIAPEDLSPISPGPYIVKLDRGALAQLFTPVDDNTVKLLDIQARIAPLPEPTDTFPVKHAPADCEQFIVLPYAKPVKVTLVPTGQLYELKSPVDQPIYASQLGKDRELCISARFGENRQVGLKLDKFGRVTEFSWQSDARGANVSGALAGAAPDAASIVTTLRDRTLTREKAELDRINTEIALRKARQCLAQMQAGSDCTGN